MKDKIIDILREEYNRENEKKKSIEARVGMTITFTSAFIVYVFSVLDIKSIYSLSKECFNFLTFLKIISASSVCVLLALVVYKLFRLLMSRPHKNFDVNQLDEDFFGQATKESQNDDLIQTYKDIITDHRTTNQKKTKEFNISILLTLIALLCFVVYLSI